MTMGFEDDGDPPTGNPGVVEDSVEDGMDLEETTVPVGRKSVEKSSNRTSTSKLAHTSTSVPGTSCKYKDKDKDKEVHEDVKRVGRVAGQSMEKLGSNSLQKKVSGTSRLANTSTRTIMGSNGHSTKSVDDNERVGMDLEASVAGQSMEKSTPAGQSVDKSGNNSLQKKASRSASGTSRLANTSTSSTMMGLNGQSTGSVNDERVGMELEKSASVVGQSVDKSGNNSLQKKASRSASGTSRLANTSTSLTMMGSNGQSTGSVNDERVGMELEKSAPVAGQSVEKSGITPLQKEISRSATSTSRVAKKITSTSATTMMGSMMGSNGHSTGSVDDARVGMDLEKIAGQSMESRSNSIQKEAPKSAGSTSTSTTTTTGMQKIDEGNEEEEEILGLKTRNWRKLIYHLP
jgi:hypothetical protein